jgi:hypothetical protein
MCAAFGYSVDAAKGWQPWGLLVPVIGLGFVAGTVVSLTALLQQMGLVVLLFNQASKSSSSGLDAFRYRNQTGRRMGSCALFPRISGDALRSSRELAFQKQYFFLRCVCLLLGDSHRQCLGCDELA